MDDDCCPRHTYLGHTTVPGLAAADVKGTFLPWGAGPRTAFCLGIAV